MRTKLVDTDSREGMYGYDTEAMIIDTDTHGRVLIMDGFGGNNVEGMMYRWRHGAAVQLKADDTFDEIYEIDELANDHSTVISWALLGYDDDRPLLDWTGRKIAAVARKHSK